MKKNILVIDDERSIQKAFILALSDTSYNVDVANNGEVGIQKMQAKDYDLVFLDLNMPVMNGIETLKKIRKFNKTIPVYIVTAFQKTYLTDLKALKEDDIQFELLNKPIDSFEIQMITKSVLEKPQIF